MPKQYTQEQLDKVLETLPDELHEAMFSMETANTIWKACEKQGIMDERMGEIAKYAGYVLMGLMLPAEFLTALKAELKLPKKTAEEMARDINRFIFYPVKPALEQLHSMEIGAKAKTVTSKPLTEEETSEQGAPEEPRGEDPYRENL